MKAGKRQRLFWGMVLKIEILRPVIVVGDAQSLIETIQASDLYIAYIACKPAGVGDELHDIVVLLRRQFPKTGLEEHLGVAVDKVGNVRLERAGFIEFAVQVENFLRAKRQRGGSFHKMRSGFPSYQQGFLVPERQEQHSVGRHFRGGVEVNGAIAERNRRDYMVKLGRRGYQRVYLAGCVDQSRVGLYACRRKERGKQRVFVFAIAVLVGEHFFCRVRLIPAYSKIETDITKIE